jgi:ketosteroid isomerase-like protein
MPAMSPQEICRLFQRYMAEGDIDSVLSVYDSEAVFLRQSGEVTKDRRNLRQELAGLAAMKLRFDFRIKQIIQTGGIALMHTEWRISGPQPMTVYAIEVARRQPDGTWCWLIGDPYTVAREVGSQNARTDKSNLVGLPVEAMCPMESAFREII